jgi:YbbR domain-containing protein
LNNKKILAKIIEKWPVKILSLAAAIIIAIFYRMNTLETRSFIVPLHVLSNDHFVPVSVFADNARINMRGDSASIYQINEDDIEAYIDFRKFFNEGTYRIPVQVRKKGSALGVEPLEISVLPMEISIILEQRIRKYIPVYPVFSGTITSGYEMTSQTIVPQSIMAEGPRTSLENQFEFITETIDLEGRNESFSVFVNIINNNNLVTVFGNRMIEFRSTIRRIETTQSIEIQRSNFENGENEE